MSTHQLFIPHLQRATRTNIPGAALDHYSVDRRFDPVSQTEFAQDIFQMTLDGCRADAKIVGNFFIGFGLREQGQYAIFRRGEY